MISSFLSYNISRKISYASAKWFVEKIFSLLSAYKQQQLCTINISMLLYPHFCWNFKKKSRKVTFNIFMSSVNFWPVSVDSSLSRWNIFCGPFSRFGTKNTYWSKSKASVRSLVVTKKILVIIKYYLALFWNWLDSSRNPVSQIIWNKIHSAFQIEQAAQPFGHLHKKSCKHLYTT